MSFHFVPAPLVVRAIWPLFVAVLGLVLLVRPVHAAPYVVLGPSDLIALDQPRVAVAVVDPNRTFDPNLGPEFSNTFLLDTGATGIVVGGNAYAELAGNGYQTVALYDEQGVAGTTTMSVSQEYDVYFAGTDGQALPIDDVRLLSHPSISLGFDGIVGMPAMVGRTTTVDMTVWSGGNLDLLTTSFRDTAPPVVPHQYHVPLTLLEFPFSGQHNPNDPTPTFAPLPEVPVLVQHNGHSSNGKFILDTGAQLSIISTSMAEALGIDLETDVVDYLDVGGIGGTVPLPLVEVGSLAVKTNERVNLVWTDLLVGVLDIDPSIQGIFGMEFLTSGWLTALFGGPDGYFNRVHFDFRNADAGIGTMVLDLRGALNHVVVPMDLNGDGVVNIGDLLLVGSNWHTSNAAGDTNGDGVVDIADVLTIGAYWGFSVPGGGAMASGVPEPGTLALALAGAAACLALRRIATRRRAASIGEADRARASR